jgi:hypothetical protein
VAHADVSILRGRDDVAAELAVLTGQMDDVAVCGSLAVGRIIM